MDSNPRHPFEPIPEGHVIEWAFEVEGVNYWTLKDRMNTFAQRALEALAVYERWNMRCTDEFIRAYANAITNTINSGKIELTAIVDLNNKLIERLSFSIPTEDIIWQFASVVFFDDKESPYRYDPDYAKEKIAFWMKHAKAHDFFLRRGIREFLPLPEISEDDLKTYLEVINKVSKKQLEQISYRLSSDQRNNASFSELLYQSSLQLTGTS